MLEDGTQFDVLQGNLYTYKGAVFENLIAGIFKKWAEGCITSIKNLGLRSIL